MTDTHKNIDVLFFNFKIESMLSILYDVLINKKDIDMAKIHPGFQAVQNKIAAKQGINKKRAGAILAASTRNASVKAKKTNPRLKKVKGY